MQRALIWQLFRHWSIFVVVLVAMLMLLEGLAGGPPRSFAEYASGLWTRHAPLFVVIATLFPVFAYDSIKLSHRFVGPIMRLRGALRSAATGDPVPALQFRKHDFWHDMADSFNELMDQVHKERKGRDRAATEVWDASRTATAADAKEHSELQEV